MKRLAAVLASLALGACAELSLLEPPGGSVDRWLDEALATRSRPPEAQRAAESLPPSLRDVKPWIRNFGILQKLLQ